MVLTLEVVIDDIKKCRKKYDSHCKLRCNYTNKFFNIKRKCRKQHTYRKNTNHRRRYFSRKRRILIL